MKKVSWFFAMTAETLSGFEDCIRVAVHTAPPSLVPHLLYDGPEDAFTREMRSRGVTVTRNRISFYERLQEAQQRRYPSLGGFYMRIAAGAFQRLDIPNLCDDEYVLYTDCDMMFSAGTDVGQFEPSTFMAAPQFNMMGHLTKDVRKGLPLVPELNSGVMVINVPQLRRDLPGILSLGCEMAEFDLGYDQQFLDIYYRGSWAPLAPSYNWKPYWGPNPLANIVHFHGPKPSLLRKFIDGEVDPATMGLVGQQYLKNPAACQAYTEQWEAYREAAAS
jgi:hypothetical protein